MPESVCRVGDIEICYETFGDPADPAVLLIMGLGMQMVAWLDDFCAALAERGFHVIRFDNRDVGRSSTIPAKPPSIWQILRRDRNVPYTLADMADDAAGLLDGLGIRAAHVFGVSMGGMIAQTLAIRHPDRVLSLVSMMSNTGSRWTGQPGLAMYAALLRPAPRDRDGYVEHAALLFGKIGSGEERDLEDVRDIARRSYDRGTNPAGFLRQLGAIVADRNRRTQLRRLDVPATVVHGTKDRLVRPSGGKATARAIRGARHVRIDGMGHDMPRRTWPRIIDIVAETAARAGEGPRGEPDAVTASS